MSQSSQEGKNKKKRDQEDNYEIDESLQFFSFIFSIFLLQVPVTLVGCHM